MQAIQWDAQADVLSLVDVPVPTAGHGQVVIKVAYAGVCGTDLHIIQKEFPAAEKVTLGHEFSGAITEIGPGVKGFTTGDRVCVDPNRGCGNCRECFKAQTNHCQNGGLRTTIGIFQNGGFANFCMVPSEQVHQLPAEVTLPQGALCEPLSCILRGWENLNNPSLDSRILILGAGIIGVLWSTIFHHKGYRDVTVSEPAEGRRNRISALGLGYQAVHPDELKSCISQENIRETGYDVIVDCSGFPPAIEQAFSWLRAGATFVQFGCCPPKEKISISPFEIFSKELKIVGCLINPFTMVNTVEGLVRGMSGSYLNDFSRLGIKMFHLQEYQEAIAQLKKGTISKAMFQFDNCMN
ncbi:D-altritol 5-dehydrogenase-like [Branchiostoma lanceolatum]|uniref:D-altritol 5-dehydrogenase-like n=1 Tax=Branchiostoma lanceolatum TaxID=7740 RepID=UPI0034563511